MSIRLNKVLSELNIGLPTTIEFLKRKGWNDIDNDAGPKTKISEEQYMALKKEFGSEEQPFVETKNNMFTKVYGNKIDKSCDNKETNNMNNTNSTEINFDESVAEWRQLRKTGRTKEARDYYCEHLFEQVIKRFIYKERANIEIETTLSKILCKWKQDSAVSFFLYLDSVFKDKHKLVHNQAPV